MKKKMQQIVRGFESRGVLLFLLLYSIFFIGISMITFSPFLIKNNSLILCGDGFNQYYPVFAYARDFWVHLIKEPSFLINQYDFSIGFGEPIFPVLIVHGFGNILYIFSIFIDEKCMVSLYGIVTILCIYISGISFSSYCFYHKRSMKGTLAGALAYAFSVYLLVDGVQFIIFLYPMMTLPIILLGVDKVMDCKNARLISKTLVISVFIQAMSGYYFLYMETIILSVYILIKYFYGCKQKIALVKLIRKVFCVVVQYLLGMMMGALMFLPSVVSFFNSTRTVGQYYGIGRFLFYNQSTYLSYLKSIVVPDGYEVSIGLPILSVLCIVYICRKRDEKNMRLFVIASIIGIFIPLISYIMNGFVFTNYRGIFATFFLWSYILAYAFDDILCVRKSDYIIAFSFTFVSLILNLIVGSFEKEVCFRVAYYIILLFLFIYLLMWSKKFKARQELMKNSILFIVLIFNICVNGMIINGPRNIGGTGLSANFWNKDAIQKSYEQSISNTVQNSEEFYRMDIRDASLNAAQVLGYNGTVEYYSMLNGYVAEFFRELSIYPGYSSPYVLLGLDGRSIFESLLSVKYYKKNAKEEITTELIQNEDMLPLGYTYNSFLERDEFQRLSVLDRSDAMMQAVVLEEKLSEDYSKNDVIISHSRLIPCLIEFQNVEREQNITVDTDSIIKISVDVPEGEGELYLFFEGCATAQVDVLELYMSIDGKEVAFNDYNYNANGIMVKVNAQSGKKDVLITFSDKGELQLDSINTYWYSKEDFADQIRSLEENTLENISFPVNRIKGNISLDENKILFFGIPFDKGWKVYVDGKEERLYRANIAFMAVPLTKGEHDIELCYTTPGIVLGMVISIIGIGLFAIWILLNKRKKEDEL